MVEKSCKKWYNYTIRKVNNFIKKDNIAVFGRYVLEVAK